MNGIAYKVWKTDKKELDKTIEKIPEVLVSSDTNEEKMEKIIKLIDKAKTEYKIYEMPHEAYEFIQQAQYDSDFKDIVFSIETISVF